MPDPALIFSDDNGVTWQDASTPFDGHEIHAIAFDGTYTVAIAGADAADGSTTVTLATSTDRGVSWTEIPNPADGNIAYGVAFAASLGQWVIIRDVAAAASANPRIFTSPDLVTWTGHATNFDWDNSGMGAFSKTAFYVAAHDRTVLVCGTVATGDQGIARSVDLATWTYPASMTNVGLEKIRFLNGSWFAVGAGASLYRSTDDGLTWVEITQPLSGLDRCTDITWDGTRYILTAAPVSGSATGLATSPDLITWTTHTTPLDTSNVQLWATAADPSAAVIGSLGFDPGENVANSLNHGDTWTGRLSGLNGHGAYDALALPNIPVSATIPPQDLRIDTENFALDGSADILKTQSPYGFAILAPGTAVLTYFTLLTVSPFGVKDFIARLITYDRSTLTIGAPIDIGGPGISAYNVDINTDGYGIWVFATGDPFFPNYMLLPFTATVGGVTAPTAFAAPAAWDYQTIAAVLDDGVLIGIPKSSPGLAQGVTWGGGGVIDALPASGVVFGSTGDQRGWAIIGLDATRALLAYTDDAGFSTTADFLVVVLTWDGTTVTAGTPLNLGDTRPIQTNLNIEGSYPFQGATALTPSSGFARLDDGTFLLPGFAGGYFAFPVVEGVLTGYRLSVSGTTVTLADTNPLQQDDGASWRQGALVTTSPLVYVGGRFGSQFERQNGSPPTHVRPQAAGLNPPPLTWAGNDDFNAGARAWQQLVTDVDRFINFCIVGNGGTAPAEQQSIRLELCQIPTAYAGGGGTGGGGGGGGVGGGIGGTGNDGNNSNTDPPSGGVGGGGGGGGGGVGGTGLGRRLAFRFGASPENVSTVENAPGYFGVSAGVLVHGLRGSIDELLSDGLVLGPWLNSGRKISFTACCMPNVGVNNVHASYVAAARGDYDYIWRNICTKVRDFGFPDAVLRPLHEFNLSYIGEWGIIDFSGNVIVPPTLFISVFRRFVQIAREVSPGFLIDFCWLIGGDIPVVDYWPGADVVDIVGNDVYDRSTWGADPVTRWTVMVGLLNGLQDQLDLATLYGKQMSFPEWGVTFFGPPFESASGGDNPYFVSQMRNWISFYNFNYHTPYFDTQDPVVINSDMLGGDFPNSLAQLRVSFGLGSG